MEIFSYLLGKKASSGGGGSSIDWTQIGYESEPKSIQESIQDGFNYAKTIQQNWDSTVTNRSNNFKDDYKLVYFPNVDTSKITNANSMFKNCYALEEIGDFDFSSITNSGSMFSSCYNLKRLGNVNLKNSYGGSTFAYCYNLKEIDSITMPIAGLSGTLFIDCKELETIREIKEGNNDHWTDSIFTGCSKLSNDTLKVILGFLKKMVNQNSNKKNLAIIGLSQTQAQTCTTFDEWTELANEGWTTGY